MVRYKGISATTFINITKNCWIHILINENTEGAIKNEQSRETSDFLFVASVHSFLYKKTYSI